MTARAHKEDTRQRLLEAGAEIMHRHGYAGMGVQEVLAACGVPKGSFYHYFASKEDFALAVLDLVAARMAEGSLALLRQPGIPPLERVRAFCDAIIRRAQDPEDLLGVCGCPIGNLVQEMAPVSPPFRKRLDAIIDGLELHLAEVLREAAQARQLAPGLDPDEAARFIAASWQGAILRMKAAGHVQPLIRARDFLLAMLTGAPPQA